MMSHLGHWFEIWGIFSQIKERTVYLGVLCETKLTVIQMLYTEFGEEDLIKANAFYDIGIAMLSNQNWICAL